MGENMNIIIILLSLFLSLFTSLFLTKGLIKVQNKINTYQPIKEELSLMHQEKVNTPIGGGIAIFIGSIIPVILFYGKTILLNGFIGNLLIFLGFFLIGGIDDFLKIFFKNNKGLKGNFRLLGEIILSFIFLGINGYGFKDFQNINLFGTSIFLGQVIILILSFIIVGSANAMNLSDGLDGLASCLFIIALMPFVIYSFKIRNYILGTYLISLFGSVIGFLILNFHPSKIFMGDSGSLYLGAVISCSAIILKHEYLLIIAGFMLIIETLSVIIQVVNYKLTKKRVFLMAPLHHHFELKGYSEERIVLLFMVLGYVFSFIAMVLIL